MFSFCKYPAYFCSLPGTRLRAGNELAGAAYGLAAARPIARQTKKVQ
jgi:hypothetical protein